MFIFLFTWMALHAAWLTANQPLHADISSPVYQNFLEDTTIHGTAVQEVLFATNEDCDLFINNEARGTVLKKEHTFLKLPSGTYTYRAKSKTSVDEMQQTFQVKDNGQNEIFIDLLYFIDERKKERELLKQVNNAAKPPVAGKTAEKTPVKKETNPDAEKTVINMLSTNMVTIKGESLFMQFSSQF